MSPATRTPAPKLKASRPLIEYPTYFEYTYCQQCMQVHMTEVTRTGRTICRDDFYTAQKARTHYSRRSGKGFELVPFTEYSNLPIDWAIAMEAKEPEYVDIDLGI